MPNFTDEQILEIVKRYNQGVNVFLKGKRNGVVSISTIFLMKQM